MMIQRPYHNKYIKPVISPDNPLYFCPVGEAKKHLSSQYVGKFSLDHFLMPEEPLPIGRYTLPVISPNILRMPIKYPGSQYRIPRMLKPILSLIETIADYEITYNALHDKSHCHITYERQFVLAGETQRMPGFHVDGFQKQGDYKTVEHSYILTDCYPTEFSLKGYDLSSFNSWTHMFSVMDKLTEMNTVIPVDSNTIYLMSCYQVHRTPKLPRSTWRTFLRVTYTPRELEDNRNTVNPLFPGQVYVIRDDIRNSLKEWT